MLYSTCPWKVVTLYNFNQAFLLTKAAFTCVISLAKMQAIATASGCNNNIAARWMYKSQFKENIKN
jgi:hypothetical protein